MNRCKSHRVRRASSGPRRAGARTFRVAPWLIFAVVLTLAITLAGCSSASSTLDPQGPAASDVSNLAWFMIILATIVAVIVIGLFIVAVLRSRGNHQPQDHQPINGNRLVLIGGLIIPGIILVALIVLSVNTVIATSAPAAARTLRVEVTGVQWWWMVRYPDQGFSTANELHIPVGRPVLVELRSADVIHSFWVPALNGKTDVIPGRTNTIWLQANKPGVYRGECAEYCGLEHALMDFEVVAEPQAQFSAWLQQQQQPARTPTTPLEAEGMHNVLRPECMGCHTIGGTPAQGTIGPDLTHIGSRQTIAGGTLPMTRQDIARFIMNPQGVKPGTKMPDLAVDQQTADAIAAYLFSLK